MADRTTQVKIKEVDETLINPATKENQEAILAKITGINIPPHDYIGLSYDGGNLTQVVYKTGGASGTTVATLTLAYSGNDLISVTKT